MSRGNLLKFGLTRKLNFINLKRVSFIYQTFDFVTTDIKLSCAFITISFLNDT